jgi:predicted peptidase
MMRLVPAILLLVMISCNKDNRENGYLVKEQLVTSLSNINGFISCFPKEPVTGQNPLIIFFHGAGQYGDKKDDLKKLWNESIPHLVQQNIFPSSFVKDNSRYSFNIIAPQFNIKPSPVEIDAFLNQALSQHSFDPQRIYLVGLSDGSEICIEYAAYTNKKIAAIVAMSGVPRYGDLNFISQSISDKRIPVWFFHNEGDSVRNISLTEDFIQRINRFEPVQPPIFTRLETFGLYGHDSWSRASDPRFKENGKNIYEWMLRYFSN